jgi:hypothetical protein
MQNIITIRNYIDYTQAYMALNRLKAEGIAAFLQNEHTVSTVPYLTNAVGGIKLNVLKEDASIALIILDTLQL